MVRARHVCVQAGSEHVELQEMMLCLEEGVRIQEGPDILLAIHGEEVPNSDAKLLCDKHRKSHHKQTGSIDCYPDFGSPQQHMTHRADKRALGETSLRVVQEVFIGSCKP